MINVEQQRIDHLVEALQSQAIRGLYDYNDADKNLLAEASRIINAREFLTVAQHQAIVQMAVRYL